MASEIRSSVIDALSERVRKRTYDKYLSAMNLVKLRGFEKSEIRFDFPVTALVGPNGAGKTTILGAAGLIYSSVAPRRFFARSGYYDDSMKGWRVSYELIDKALPSAQLAVSRTASYLQAKWNRDAVKRAVIVVGIDRTLPATERSNMYKFVKGDFKGVRETQLTDDVIKAVALILGKEAAHYLLVDADLAGKNSIFAARDTAAEGHSYSEFHFGAGEASIIKIVSQIEAVEDQSLVLIEEIENGLHPVATRRLVEYLLDVARRKSCQVIFTTHSNDALAPLPNDAVWSAYRGRLTQGKLDVAALRTLNGNIDARLAVFTEDKFDEMFADVTLRACTSRSGLDRASIKIHALGGAAPARDHTRFHNANPTRTFPAVCLLDGDKRNETGYAAEVVEFKPSVGAAVSGADVIYGPGGSDPESVVFQMILDNIEQVLVKLTITLGLDTPHQEQVRNSMVDRKSTNRDVHLIFAQIGEDLDFLSADWVARAFVSVWSNTFPGEVDKIWDPCAALFPRLNSDADK